MVEGRRGGLVWSFNHGIAISTQIGVSLNLGKQRLARAQFRASLGVVMNAVMMGLLATVLWFGRCGVCPPSGDPSIKWVQKINKKVEAPIFSNWVGKRCSRDARNHFFHGVGLFLPRFCGFYFGF